MTRYPNLIRIVYKFDDVVSLIKKSSHCSSLDIYHFQNDPKFWNDIYHFRNYSKFLSYYFLYTLKSESKI